MRNIWKSQDSDIKFFINRMWGRMLRHYYNEVSVVALLMYSRGSKQMAAILDQKNYLEELNRHLKWDALCLHLSLFFYSKNLQSFIPGFGYFLLICFLLTRNCFSHLFQLLYCHIVSCIMYLLGCPSSRGRHNIRTDQCVFGSPLMNMVTFISHTYWIFKLSSDSSDFSCFLVPSR